MNNLDKLMQYLQVVAKSDTEVDGNIYHRDVNRIQLASTAFLLDGCNSCGCCDVPESNVYVQFEYDRIINITEPEYHSYNKNLDINQLYRLRNGLKEEKHIINGKEISVYVFKLEKQDIYVQQRGKVIDRCTWAYQPTEGSYHFYCNIHPVTSITCKMPHLRFLHSSRSKLVSIGIYQFGRNWAVKCPVVFKEPEDETEFNTAKSNRLEKLSYLLEVANEFGIDTYLPEIIEYVNGTFYKNYKDRLQVPIIDLRPKQIKLF